MTVDFVETVSNTTNAIEKAKKGHLKFTLDNQLLTKQYDVTVDADSSTALGLGGLGDLIQQLLCDLLGLGTDPLTDEPCVGLLSGLGAGGLLGAGNNEDNYGPLADTVYPLLDQVISSPRTS